MRAEPTCPSCGEPLELEESKSLLGLVRQTPSQCDHCGARLAYATTGEVFVIEDDDPSDG